MSLATILLTDDSQITLGSGPQVEAFLTCSVSPEREPWAAATANASAF